MAPEEWLTGRPRGQQEGRGHPSADPPRRRGPPLMRRPEVIVLVLGLLISVTAWWVAARWEGERRQADFREIAEDYARASELELRGVIAAVESIGDYYRASEAVTVSEFAQFTRPLLRRNPTIAALEWIPRVPAAERDDVEARARAQGLVDFAIRELVDGRLRPAGERPDYFPVYRLEPLNSNAAALGFDLGAEPQRRAALERALATGLPAATPPLTLVQGQADRPGLVVFVPAALGVTADDATTQGGRRPQGVAAGLIHPDQLLEQVVDRFPPHGIDLLLLDPALEGERRRLHLHPSRTDGADAIPDWTLFLRDPRAYTTRLLVADRALELRALPTPGSDPPDLWPLLLLGLGLALSLISALLVSQRQRTATQLREREDLFRLFMEHSATVTWVKDEHGRRVYVSKSFERSFGARPGGWLGKTDAEVWPADLAEQFIAADQAALAQDRPLEVNHVAPTVDGGLRDWQSLRIPFRDQAGRRYLGGISLDVTERKRTEEALRRSEQRMALAQDAAHVGTWEWVLADNRNYWSDSLYLLYGLVPGECEASYQAWASLIHPDDHDRVIAMAGAAAGAGSEFEAQWRVKRPAGEPERWLLSRGRPVVGANGAVERYIGIVIDITASKQAELELRRYQQIVETSSEMLVFVDADQRLRLINPAYAALRQASPAQLQGRLVREVVGAEAYAQVGPRLEAALAGESTQLRMPITGADGRRRYLESSYQPFRGHDGSVLGVVISIHDVTEAREAQAALKRQQADLAELVAARTAELEASETKLRTIYDLLPIGISVTDGAGRIVDCNRAAETLLGIARDEHFRRTYTGEEWPIIRPNETTMPPHEYASVRAATEGQTVRDVEMGIIKPDGVVWLSVSAMPYPTPDFGVVIAYVDVTARKQAEAQLHASEARARAIIDVSPVPLALSEGRSGRFLYLNPALVATFGYTLDDTPTLRHWQRAAYPDRDYRRELAAAAADYLARVRQHAASAAAREIKIRCKDGTTHTAMVRATPLGEAAGGLHLITLYDVTDLLQARQLAEQATRMKSEFLANMSHEIRTPLNAVLGFCYLLERQPLDAAAHDLAAKIRSAGGSLLRLINDILDFSKIEAGRLELESAPLCLSGLLDDLAVIMTAAAGRKDLELIIAPHPSGIDEALLGDPGRLKQVLINLLSNAIKFTERGEVELRIGLESADARRVRLRFTVRDTGIGISSDQQAEVFSAFTQADASIGRRFGGTGLGLAISRQLVALMGGELRVESVLGQGSEFWFVLEFQRDHQGPPTPPELARLHLLVADDSAAAGAALAATAATLGWTADLVSAGAAALDQTLAQLASPRPYDVLLLDWDMPGQDGLTAARVICDRLRARTDASRTPPIVIMATAYAREELLAAPGIGAVDVVLNKPATPSALYDAVGVALSRQRPRRRLAPPRSTPGPAPRIPGVRVLVVDDSEINREVARGILEADGARVHLAGDGQEAVDWLQAHPDGVDVVLMDVQMPRMNGYTATRRIRQDARWRALPIVALTAGAFTTLQDSARDCGMNDFVAKPFDVDHLMAMIARWTGHPPVPPAVGPGAPTPQTEPPGDGAAASPVLPASLPGIDLVAGLKQWRKVVTYRTYLDNFVANYAGAGVTIANLWRDGDRAASAALAHKLVGVAGGLALPRVQELVSRLEIRLSDDDPVAQDDAITTLTAPLQTAIDEVCTSVAEWPRGDRPVSAPPPGAATGDPADVRALLAQFLLALDRNDPERSESLLAQLQGLMAAPSLADIQLRLAEFDFRAAETLTRTLLLDRDS